MKRTVLLAAAIAGCWLAAPTAFACGNYMHFSARDRLTFAQRARRLSPVTENARDHRSKTILERLLDRKDRVPNPFELRQPQANESGSAAVPRC